MKEENIERSINLFFIGVLFVFVCLPIVVIIKDRREKSIVSFEDQDISIFVERESKKITFNKGSWLVEENGIILSYRYLPPSRMFPVPIKIKRNATDKEIVMYKKVFAK